MGATMLRESQVLALAAIASGGFIAVAVYYVWPELYWWAYPLIGVAAVGPAYQPWAGVRADEKIIDRRLMHK
jgi:hypothetical protein